jgi:hypothetical protein
MNKISMIQAVTDFHSVYKVDKKGGTALVKEYVKDCDLTTIRLIITNQRQMALDMKKESHIFSPMKLAFFLLVVMGGVANAFMMQNATFIYAILFVALFMPFWDSYSMVDRYMAHKLFADVLEAEIPFFREYSKAMQEQKVSNMLDESGSSKFD